MINYSCCIGTFHNGRVVTFYVRRVVIVIFYIEELYFFKRFMMKYCNFSKGL